MATPQPTGVYEVEPLKDGVMHIRLETWDAFPRLINRHFLSLPEIIWRGQRKDVWKLESTLDRAILERKNKQDIIENHLSNFKYSIRGRRGLNPREFSQEDEYWAIGQHNSLATPLLDWTTAPYVALFFAFAQKDDNEKNEHRSVFALNMNNVRKHNKSFSNDITGRKYCINTFKPLSDENPRLVNQAGLFTITKSGMDLESTVKVLSNGISDVATLIKIKIPSVNRNECLLGLNKMNINYASLFPDMYGAAKHCNLKLEIENY